MDALQTLEDSQRHLHGLVGLFNPEQSRQQFHQDLSPAGWHLGHCVFTEDYWIHEQVLQDESLTRDLKSLYIPELSPKAKRGTALPDLEALFTLAEQRQGLNRLLLEELRESHATHPLIRDDYLPLFLAQHYAQHSETVAMIRQLAMIRDQPATPVGELPALQDPGDDLPEWIEISQGDYSLGSHDLHVYDNEKPAHQHTVETCCIASKPVSNAMYLAFMQDGGYARQEFWDETGWQWLSAQQRHHPLHWLKHPHGGWLAMTLTGPEQLQAELPVYGINQYEAQACARWAACRLPSEQEWEVACRLNRLEDIGLAWEWCANAFYPYPGFKAWPYDGYSSPYFDQRHFVLRGAGPYTQPIIRRCSFRNYYTADKRHIFAGLRLAR